MEHDYVGGICGLGVGSAAEGDVGVEFGGGDGGEVGGVGLGDGDAVGWVQEGEDAVETFWGELVVGEGAEELGDQNVDWIGCSSGDRLVGGAVWGDAWRVVVPDGTLPGTHV